MRELKQHHFEQMLLPNRLWKITPKDLTPREHENLSVTVREWLSNWDQRPPKPMRDLLVVGERSEILMSIVAQGVARREFSVRCVSAHQLLSEITNDSECVDRLKNVSFLCVHHLFENTKHDYQTRDKLLEILSYRSDFALPSMMVSKTPNFDAFGQYVDIQLHFILKETFKISL